MAGKRSALIQTAHPYLETINEKTKLSAFLGLRSDRRAILIDKVDSAYGIKVSSEIGMQMPILAGAGTLDRSIIVLLYKTNACENMNKLRSGRPWLRREAKK